MKQVYVPALDRRVSSIGFGCASLGSRVGRRRGIKALERAHDAGINWYDVAPSYGDGMAETILGEFAAGKRDGVCICTKVGMLAPRSPAPLRLLKPLLRAAATRLPALRRFASRAKPPPFKVPLSAELIRSSVEESLKRLRTDHVDVLALHRATVGELRSEEVIRASEDVIRAGKARAVSIAGDLDAGIASLDESLPYRFVQITNSPLQPNLRKLKVDLRAARTVVTHGTYACLGQLVAILSSHEQILQALVELGNPGSPAEVAAAFLANYAFATNTNGVTLFSMFGKDHLDFNLLHSADHPAQEPLETAAAMLEALSAG